MKTVLEATSQRIIIFDSLCILCNKSLDILMRLDKNKVLRYTSSDGEYVKQLDIKENIDSIIFYDEGKLYYKSTAILKILRSLGGIWIFTNISYIIPRFLRDGLYDMIAKYRYEIFGKLQNCRMPKEGEEELFLD